MIKKVFFFYVSPGNPFVCKSLHLGNWFGLINKPVLVPAKTLQHCGNLNDVSKISSTSDVLLSV